MKRFIVTLFRIVWSFVKYKILHYREGVIQYKWSGKKKIWRTGDYVTHYKLIVGDGFYRRGVRVSKKTHDDVPIGVWFSGKDEW